MIFSICYKRCFFLPSDVVSQSLSAFEKANPRKNVTKEQQAEPNTGSDISFKISRLNLTSLSWQTPLSPFSA
jgi:hypothetical protein